MDKKNYFFTFDLEPNEQWPSSKRTLLPSSTPRQRAVSLTVKHQSYLNSNDVIKRTSEGCAFAEMIPIEEKAYVKRKHF
jgi:hypothetical protein